MISRIKVLSLVAGFAMTTSLANTAFAQEVEDVNRDSVVNAADAYDIIYHLNTFGSSSLGLAQFMFGLTPFNEWALSSGFITLEGILGVSTGQEQVYARYRMTWRDRDVNGDGHISPIDALIVINRLNNP